MTPEDKQAARQALERGLLTIEQVETLRVEAERTGRPFAALARERGLLHEAPRPLPPPAPPPPPPRTGPLFPALLGASFLILTGLLVATIVSLLERSRKERDLQLESARLSQEAERKAREAGQAYHRRRIGERENEARASLERARKALEWVDERLGKAPTDPSIHDRAVEATIALHAYLEEFPDDPDALALRSRAWELRRNYDLALKDLERAVSLRPELGKPHRLRLDLLRKLNAKPGSQ